MSAVVKTTYKECSTCFRIYESRNQYEATTAYVGVISTGKYSDRDLELRNCVCGSTLATHCEEEKKDAWPSPVKRVK